MFIWGDVTGLAQLRTSTRANKHSANPCVEANTLIWAQHLLGKAFLSQASLIPLPRALPSMSLTRQPAYPPEPISHAPTASSRDRAAISSAIAVPSRRCAALRCAAQRSAAQRSAAQRRAEQGKAEQSRAEQSRASQGRAEQSSAEQSRARHPCLGDCSDFVWLNVLTFFGELF